MGEVSEHGVYRSFRNSKVGVPSISTADSEAESEGESEEEEEEEDGWVSRWLACSVESSRQSD